MNFYYTAIAICDFKPTNLAFINSSNTATIADKSESLLVECLDLKDVQKAQIIRQEIILALLGDGASLALAMLVFASFSSI